ncbi:6-bladed beta-propeller [Bacteroides sp. f07]
MHNMESSVNILGTLLNNSRVSLLGIACLLSCCQSSSRIDNSMAVVSDYIDVVQDTSLFSNPHVFMLEQAEQSLIASIDHVIEHDSTYYILDKRTNQVLFYTHNGRFMHAIKSVGNGPGEYVRLMDIALDPTSSQLVLLSYPSTLLYYDLEGEYIKTIHLGNKTSFHSLVIDEKYIYLSKPTFYNDKLEETSITVVSKQHPDEKYDILEPLPEIAPYCHFRGRTLMRGLTPLFTRKFDNHIYSLKGKEILPEIDINWGGYEFPESMKEHKFSCVELLKYCLGNKYIYEISNVVESERSILFSTNLPGIFILDKLTQDIVHYGKIMNVDYGILMPNYMFVESDNNRVFFVYPAYELVKMKENVKDAPEKRKKYPEKLLSLLEQITEESNPVIFSYDFGKK